MSEEQIEQTAEQAAETIVNSPEVTEVIEQAAETIAEAVVTASEPVNTGAPEEPVVTSTAQVEYYFEGTKVEEVQQELPDGTKLCRMSDGTTKHVPASIFN